MKRERGFYSSGVSRNKANLELQLRYAFLKKIEAQLFGSTY